MSNRKKLSPASTARRDQALARAVDLTTRNPGLLIFFEDYAPDGTPCCWCDCKDVAAHRANRACTGCDRSAVNVISLIHQGKPAGRDYPLCEPHKEAFAAETQDKTPGAVRTFYGPWDT